MAEKNYKDLEREVWEKGLCTRCGACTAVCPADAFTFPPGSPAHPEPPRYCKMEADDVSCGSCYLACPRVEDLSLPEDPVGDYLLAVTAKATFPIPGRQSGGAVTALLVNALERGLVDAVVTVAQDPWTRKPQSVVITEKEALVAQAGSRYNWWVPLLAALKEAVVVRKYRRVAVVALPCAAAALARIRSSGLDLHAPYARAVRLVVGLFCTETFDYERLMEGKVRGELGIEPWEIERMDVRGSLKVTAGEQIFEIPLDELETCIPEGCRHCTDFAAWGADISAGAVGSPEGYTTLLIRTSAGRGFFEEAMNAGLLEVGEPVDLARVEALAEKKMARR
ncbi:hypothetical protein RJ40_04920 [Methanofollis aquaemaris]|uniref:4Fe-4S ferredoxin-type domain-containing protein n=1 Tax=Methanofollis aquaemaris TaxID=126734 RepID=A0A8A3S496_9EURY|nr:Coenzyme F420 hydrogenase/dehydrogenase, beta subunit C-terminal domain [Methanofollis aquaemaris]QSZ66882.1 hypothetical protein RJ40_04920 [Methanofollis aquaemaris]